MKISKTAKNVQPSLTRKLFNMAQKLENVIDLTLGDPDLGTPDEIKEAGISAINLNNTHYSANAGLYKARQAVARNVNEVWNVKCNPETNVIITVGGMEALYLSLLTLIDIGDEVIIFAPYYVNYVQMVEMCGGNPVIIDCYDNEKGLNVDEKLLCSSINDKTVAIIVNSPNNPTGQIVDSRFLELIAEIADANDLTILSDEVYRTLTYDGKSHNSILQFEKAWGRTVLIDSMSKQFSMTGWRIGYAFAPELIIENMAKLQENVVACAPLPSQYALIEAYNNDIDTDYIITEFQKRRDFLCNKLANSTKLEFLKPQGTFYMFLNIRKTGLLSFDFACKLLEQKKVAVVPGVAYGSSYDCYVRIAFTKKLEQLSEAADKIIEFVNEL